MSTPDPQPIRGGTSRRRTERRPVSMNGSLVRENGICHVIELIDLNYGGCAIRTPVELQSGESVQLTVFGLGSIPAEVRWCREGRAGLDFNPEIKPTKKVVERRSDRSSVNAEVSLRTLGRNTYRVKLHNLSTEGCTVQFVERPSVGDHVSVKFEGLDSLEGEVCWVEDRMAGLMFKRPVHPAVFDLLLMRLHAS